MQYVYIYRTVYTTWSRAKCDVIAEKRESADIRNVEVGVIFFISDKNHWMSYDVFIAFAKNKSYPLMI